MIILPTPHHLQKAASLLRQEEIVVFPTETVYGMGALARSDKAVLKIFETKGRPFYNPLIVHVGSIAQAQTIGLFNELTQRIASIFWPGPLTVIVPKKPNAAL